MDIWYDLLCIAKMTFEVLVLLVPKTVARNWGKQKRKKFEDIIQPL